MKCENDSPMMIEPRLFRLQSVKYGCLPTVYQFGLSISGYAIGFQNPFRRWTGEPFWTRDNWAYLSKWTRGEYRGSWSLRVMFLHVGKMNKESAQ